MFNDKKEIESLKKEVKGLKKEMKDLKDFVIKRDKKNKEVKKDTKPEYFG